MSLLVRLEIYWRPSGPWGIRVWHGISQVEGRLFDLCPCQFSWSELHDSEPHPLKKKKEQSRQWLKTSVTKSNGRNNSSRIDIDTHWHNIHYSCDSQLHSKKTVQRRNPDINITSSNQCALSVPQMPSTVPPWPFQQHSAPQSHVGTMPFFSAWLLLGKGELVGW